MWSKSSETSNQMHSKTKTNEDLDSIDGNHNSGSVKPKEPAIDWPKPETSRSSNQRNGNSDKITIKTLNGRVIELRPKSTLPWMSRSIGEFINTRGVQQSSAGLKSHKSDLHVDRDGRQQQRRRKLFGPGVQYRKKNTNEMNDSFHSNVSINPLNNGFQANESINRSTKRSSHYRYTNRSNDRSNDRFNGRFNDRSKSRSNSRSNSSLDDRPNGRSNVRPNRMSSNSSFNRSGDHLLAKTSDRLPPNISTNRSDRLAPNVNNKGFNRLSPNMSANRADRMPSNPSLNGFNHLSPNMSNNRSNELPTNVSIHGCTQLLSNVSINGNEENGKPIETKTPKERVEENGFKSSEGMVFENKSVSKSNRFIGSYVKTKTSIIRTFITSSVSNGSIDSTKSVPNSETTSHSSESKTTTKPMITTKPIIKRVVVFDENSETSDSSDEYFSICDANEDLDK